MKSIMIKVGMRIIFLLGILPYISEGSTYYKAIRYPYDGYIRVKGVSMNPVLYDGDIVAVSSVGYDRLVVGDVVVFRRSCRNICHRIVGIGDGGFITRGDNNGERDNGLVTVDNYIGYVIMPDDSVGDRVMVYAELREMKLDDRRLLPVVASISLGFPKRGDDEI